MENGQQFGDLLQFVDFAYTARVARVNGAALANLAWAPTAPKNAKIDTTQLTNDTTLKWDANPEPDLAGYEVVWRESTDPLWTHSIPVGNVTTLHDPGPVEGQRPGRRARRGPRRLPQPGGVPGARSPQRQSSTSGPSAPEHRVGVGQRDRGDVGEHLVVLGGIAAAHVPGLAARVGAGDEQVGAGVACGSGRCRPAGRARRRRRPRSARPRVRRASRSRARRRCPGPRAPCCGNGGRRRSRCASAHPSRWRRTAPRSSPRRSGLDAVVDEHRQRAVGDRAVVGEAVRLGVMARGRYRRPASVVVGAINAGRRPQALDPGPDLPGAVHGHPRHLGRERRAAVDPRGPRLLGRRPAVGGQRLHADLRRLPAPRRPRGRPARPPARLRGRAAALRGRLAGRRPVDQPGHARPSRARCRGWAAPWSRRPRWRSSPPPSRRATSATARSATGARWAPSADRPGVLLGGVLTQLLGWQWILFINVPVGILGVDRRDALHPGEHARGRRASATSTSRAR